jgi:hypothetical protein
MVQRELEFASVGVSGNTLDGGTFDGHSTPALLGRRQGGHPVAAFAGEEAVFRPV